MISRDEKWMAKALQLARKGQRRVSPNPLVGAVVVRGGRKISEGYHAYFGGEHAESRALRKAGWRARGATLYVTLEPCSSWGKTPPCVDRVLSSRVGRVVIGSLDPNPQNHRLGTRRLKQAGIQVQYGILAQEVEKQNEAFFKRMRTGFPFVTLKMAQSLDGKIATSQGESRWISSEISRAFVHRLRSEADAVLVGKNTALQDNPRLQAFNRAPKPWRIVLDPQLELSPKSRVFQGTPLTFIATSEAKMVQIRENHFPKGHVLIPLPMKGRHLDLSILLRQLCSLGVNHLLAEGGGELAWSLIEGGWVDRLIWIVAPKIIGGRDTKTSVEGTGIKKLKRAFSLQWKKVYSSGEDWIFEARFSCLRAS